MLLNNLIHDWQAQFLTTTIENSLFLLFILLSLRLFRKSNARVLKGVVLIGFVKLWVPPFWETSLPASFSSSPSLSALTPAAAPVTVAGHSVLTVNMLFILWLTGVVVLVFFLGVKYVLLLRRVRHGMLIDHLKFRRIPVVQTTYAHSPFTIGLFYPRIVVPVFWDKLTRHQQKIVIAHEVEHIRQYDGLILGLALFASILNFFNPLVWVLFYRLRIFSEISCDDSTICSLEETSTHYLKELIHILEKFPPKQQPVIPLTRFAGIYRHNKYRFTYQLTKKENTMRQLRYLGVWGIITMLIFVACSGRGLVKQNNDLVTNGYYNFFALDQKPRMQYKAVPKYPAEARKNKIEGQIVVRVFIDAQGRVENTAILHGGDPLLEKAAQSAARKITFIPGRYKGKNVKCSMAVPYVFKMNPENKE